MDAGSRVVGYLFGRVAADEAEVLNLAVHPEHRRRGVARTLLDRAMSAFREAGAKTVYLEVRETNHVAQEFYRSYGFQAVGKRPRYYRNPPEAAVLMARSASHRFRPEK
jgi:ribosomal-protein-alanine acetyltransferase